MPAVTLQGAGGEGEGAQFASVFFLVLCMLAYLGQVGWSIYDAIEHRLPEFRALLLGADGLLHTIKLRGDDKALESGFARSAAAASGAEGGGGGGDAAAGESALAASRGRYRAKLTPFWIAYELVVCALMLAALATLCTYNFSLTPRASFAVSARPYDADLYAPARYFLPRRAAAASAAAGAPPAGAPGRWRLPEDGGGLRDLAVMFAHLGGMNAAVSAYNALQGLVLAALIVRLINLLAFQPKLSLISGTLVRAAPLSACWLLLLLLLAPPPPPPAAHRLRCYIAVSKTLPLFPLNPNLLPHTLPFPCLLSSHRTQTQARFLPDLLNFCLVFMSALVLFAGFVAVMFGDRAAAAATFGDAIATMLKYLVVGDDGGLLADVGDRSVSSAWPVRLAAGLVISVGPIAFTMVTINFILAMLAAPYEEARAMSASARAMPPGQATADHRPPVSPSPNSLQPFPPLSKPLYNPQKPTLSRPAAQTIRQGFTGRAGGPGPHVPPRGGHPRARRARQRAHRGHAAAHAAAAARQPPPPRRRRWPR